MTGRRLVAGCVGLYVPLAALQEGLGALDAPVRRTCASMHGSCAGGGTGERRRCVAEGAEVSARRLDTNFVILNFFFERE